MKLAFLQYLFIKKIIKTKFIKKQNRAKTCLNVFMGQINSFV